MKSYIVHYKNKYPNGHVFATENAIDVMDREGYHVVALRKSGSGQWQDESAEYGCSGKHCLAPIPKDSRVFKLKTDGSIGLDEKANERKSLSQKFEIGSKIGSCEELKAHGFEFCDKQKVIAEPKKEEAKVIETPRAPDATVLSPEQTQQQAGASAQ